METWNREELYVEIWEQPLIKVATKDGISAVALGQGLSQTSDSPAGPRILDQERVWETC
jgi:hypothetical protein